MKTDYSSNTRTSTNPYQAMVEQIFLSSQLSRQDHLQLTSAILSDYHVTEEERRQINRIFDDIQMGRLKIFS